VSTAEFEAMTARGDFLEWANVYGHLYGTGHAQVERERAADATSFWKSMSRVRQAFVAWLRIRKRFILPPSFELLRQRLTARGTDSAADSRDV